MSSAEDTTRNGTCGSIAERSAWSDQEDSDHGLRRGAARWPRSETSTAPALRRPARTASLTAH